jgi:hypothetical protein
MNGKPRGWVILGMKGTLQIGIREMGTLQIGIRAMGTLQIGIRAMGTLQIGIRAKVSTLSLDGLIERSLDQKKNVKRNWAWNGQFRTLSAPVCQVVA